MPSVEFTLTDLESLLGRLMPRDVDGLNEILAFVKGDVESIDQGKVTIEVKDSNRPDIWSAEGIAHALKGYLGISRPRNIKLAGESNLNLVIDKQVKEIRPFISAAIIRGLQPTEETLKGWINLQDKLDYTYGRKRKRASIGFYQADLVQSPLLYTVADPDTVKFAPLGTNEKSSLREILTRHPKGLEYGSIISSFDKWPILIDGADRVLSLPPIINSNDLGKITTDTKNILVEVTGTSAETVHNTLKIVAFTLAERGGRVYSCNETYSYGTPRKVKSPNFAPTATRLTVSYINKLLGTFLTTKGAERYLERAGYIVRTASRDSIRIEIPAYRIDIMHPVDIIEDIAIAMNLNELKPEWPRIWTVGGLSRETRETEAVEEIMVGLGFQQVLTYALTSPVVVNQNMRTQDPLVELLNPKLSTHTVLRSGLLPSLFEFLSHNTHVDYPQKIFEAGTCIDREESNLPILPETRKLAAVTIHANSGFTEIRSSLDALVQNTGRDFRIAEKQHPSFLQGRCGSIRSKDREIGVIGEVSPLVLRSWGLNLPAAAFELELTSLFANEPETTVEVN